jgi:hypothetical protein
MHWLGNVDQPLAPTARHRGRIIGVLLILHMTGSGMMNFVLESSLFSASGFLINAASHAWQIGLAALLGLVTGALWVGAAITAFPIFCRQSRALALWLLALAVAVFAVGVLEHIGMMSMLSVSQAYMKASAAERTQLEAVRVIVSSARNWPHYMVRILTGGAIFVLHAALYRGALVPRALAVCGMFAAVLMVTAIAMPLFGHDVVFPLLAPVGLCQLVLAVWLVTKDFAFQKPA